MTHPRRTTRLTPEIAPITPALPPQSEFELLREIAALRKHLHFVQEQLGRTIKAIQEMGPLVPTEVRRRKR